MVLLLHPLSSVKRKSPFFEARALWFWPGRAVVPSTWFFPWMGGGNGESSTHFVSGSSMVIKLGQDRQHQQQKKMWNPFFDHRTLRHQSNAGQGGGSDGNWFIAIGFQLKGFPITDQKWTRLLAFFVFHPHGQDNTEPVDMMAGRWNHTNQSHYGSHRVPATCRTHTMRRWLGAILHHEY